ncbi:pyridoxamine 5'-phosphate oxidase family protein [Streptomyces sp. NBC_01275]|uniref:pyridoxamine 5'-phosphate oxidase family protein n=1 Tax=Streptomyces sp. NBC_01275 TaxID=2903807 RepID=UPI002255A8ED|nr:pyridoxamine 5'-phosphate oxidase family protein [Streptomyces sp. NBC_01275]MCX4766617.1 pyridoxamine 5'-phosphate oxidase family protein [Streptomyces sp. NBC_01275]
MSAAEIEEFLRAQPVCRVAVTASDGHPHISPLWFVWDGAALWLNSLVRSRRWSDAVRQGRVAVVVDEGGSDFLALRGVELRGPAEVVGEVPRAGEPRDELLEPERLFGEKYAGGRFRYDRRHGWLRVVPQEVVSWDFGKLRR